MSSGGDLGVIEFLKLENWFEVITLLGVVFLIVSITIPTQIVSNELIAIFGAGMFILGIGRWKNQKSFAGVQGGFIVSGERRISDVMGIALEILGILVLVYGFEVLVTGDFAISI